MRRPVVIVIALAVLAAALATALVVGRDPARSITRSTATVTIGSTAPGATADDDVRLEIARYVPDGVDADHPAPAVLLAQGLGEDLDDLRRPAEQLAQRGYVVITWNPRGIGDSTGRVGIAGPDDVADVRALIDELARFDDVERNARNDPRVAIVGTSLGGGLGLLAAAADRRIDAVVSIFGWASLTEALEPNGVLKLAWASTLFAASSGEERTPRPCGRLDTDLCAAWSASAQAGALTEATQRALTARSTVATDDVRRTSRAPVLIVQGQFDSLFGFDQAEQLAADLDAYGVPHRVEWVRGGHDTVPGRDTQRHVDQAVDRWLARYLKDDESVDVGPRLTVQLGAGRGYASSDQVAVETRDQRVSLNAVDHTDRNGRVRFAAPPAGLPASTTTLPGLGDVTGLDEVTNVPSGQTAHFEGRIERDGLELVGTPRVRLRVTSSSPDVTLFVHLIDIAPSGAQLVPRALVTPVRLTGVPELEAPRGQEVAVTLPPIAWRVAPGHRIGLAVASTDAGYAASGVPATIAVGLDEDEYLEVPVATDLEIGAGDGSGSGADHATRNRLLASAALALAALLVGVGAAWRAARRERIVDEDPALAATPIVVEHLEKRFRGSVTAVDDVSFRVEPGSIVGLVGPNGAGKTTVLRMLLGLARPTAGRAWVFGQVVRPGAPMLRRVGALVEGPGLAPHHTGRQHLERYWGATGRPRSEADIDGVLAAVELSADQHRRVSTWSHGMRQRLGIAQALLGDPDVVVLDEPTNGLDPAQIRHLRELIRDVARAGRTVLLSSHLLSELEQVSTHVVLVAGGRVLASGTLDQVIAEHDDLEGAFLAAIAAAEARSAFGDPEPDPRNHPGEETPDA